MQRQRQGGRQTDGQRDCDKNRSRDKDKGQTETERIQKQYNGCQRNDAYEKKREKRQGEDRKTKPTKNK